MSRGPPWLEVQGSVYWTSLSADPALCLRPQNSSRDRLTCVAQLPRGSASRQLRKSSLGATAIGGGRDLGAAAAPLHDTPVLLADPLGASARAADGSNIAIVGVYADEIGGHAIGPHVPDDNVAGTPVVGAVSARAIQFAGIDDGKAINRDRAAAVVLHHLVHGLLGAASPDEDVPVAQSGDGIYWRQHMSSRHI